MEEEDQQSPATPYVGVSLPISRTLRVCAAVALTAMLLACIAIILGYLFFGKADWEPAKFDLISLIIFCFLGLAVCLLPWENYQVKIAKIGPFELREALSAQAQERELDIHELSKRIEKLEGAAPGGDDEAPAAAAESNALLGLLKNFLKDNERYSFNASRIWSRDPNNFGSFETSEIRRALRETVSEGAAETRVSQKGNTLYRAAKK